MRMLFLCQGWNSGTNEALLDAWRRGSPNVPVVTCDVATLALGRLGRLGRKVRRAMAAVGVGRGAGGDRVRSKWYFDRMAAALTKPSPAAGCSVALVFGTTIPAAVLPMPYFLYTDHTILSNLYYPDGPEHVQRWSEALPIEQRTIDRAQMVFTMSEHVARSLREHYRLPGERILQVGAGCNVPHRAPVDPARFARKNVVFVGVDWNRKGGPDLLEAFAKVRRRHPDATLTILGCRPKAAAPGVRIVGRVSQKRTARYLAGATVFCMPSLREPFGIAFLEAMRAGLPVVGLNLGATPDFIVDGQTGYRVAPGDIDQLADRLDRLLSDPLGCRRMGERGRRLVQAEYTWGRVQRRMADAMARAVNMPGIETTATPSATKGS